MSAPAYRRCPTSGAMIFDAPADARLDALERRVAALEAALLVRQASAPAAPQTHEETAA